MFQNQATFQQVTFVKALVFLQDIVNVSSENVQMVNTLVCSVLYI